MKKATKSKKYFKRLLLAMLLLVLGFIAFLLYETKDEINADINTIESKLQSFYNEKRMGGFSVSVFNGDSVLYSNGFGYSDLKTKLPYTKATLQYTASIAKTTIGISLLKAQELGLLNIDDPINAHLPFTVQNPNFPSNEITIKHLATHTSSMDYNEKVVESIYVNDLKKDPSLEQFMKDYFDSEVYGEVAFTNHRPGENWNYSNIASGLAAYIIELKSGLPFSEFTQKYIFDPLEMNQTKWFEHEVDSTLISKYYEPNEDDSKIKQVATNGVKLYSNRDLLTNIEDMTRYGQALISKNPKLLTTASYETLFSSQVESKVMDSNLDNHGIFFMIDRNIYGIVYKMIGMNGGDNCINTMMWFDPKTELGYIFIGNTGGSNLNRSNHILIYRALVSLGEHALANNPNSNLFDKLTFKWHNLYSRVYAIF